MNCLNIFTQKRNIAIMSVRMHVSPLKTLKGFQYKFNLTLGILKGHLRLSRR